MQARRIMANLRVADVDAAKSFYTDYLGLSTEEFNMGWVARYTSPDGDANVQLVTRDAKAPEDSVISVHTDDVDAAYEEARELGYEVVIVNLWDMDLQYLEHLNGSIATPARIRTMWNMLHADYVATPLPKDPVLGSFYRLQRKPGR